MKFRIQVENDAGDPWWETVDKPITDAQKWAEDTIEQFNNSLRSGELPRRLITVEILDVDSNAEHSWRKASLVTEQGGYDRYACEVCDVTGKRHGLSEHIIIDPKFKAKCYQRCDTSKAHRDKTRRLATKKRWLQELQNLPN